MLRVAFDGAQVDALVAVGVALAVARYALRVALAAHGLVLVRVMLKRGRHDARIVAVFACALAVALQRGVHGVVVDDRAHAFDAPLRRNYLLGSKTSLNLKKFINFIF